MNDIWLNPLYSKTAPRTAIFTDRDGTLIRHIDYLSDPTKVELLPGTRAAIHTLLKKEIPVFILTNQSGVGRGYFPIERVHACQQRLFELLGLRPESIAGWCVAPENPDTPGGYRKPSARFVTEACSHLGLAPKDCHVVGDTLVDLQTAWNAGARAWAVASGKPELPTAHREGTIAGGQYLFSDNFAAVVRAIIDETEP